MAIELDIIQKSGSWFSYEGNKLGQGRDNIKEIILADPDMMNELEEKIRKRLKEMEEEKAAEEAAASAEKQKKSPSSRLEAAAAKAAAVSAEESSEDISSELGNDEEFDEFTPV
jgi:recombination protein RecA